MKEKLILLMICALFLICVDGCQKQENAAPVHIQIEESRKRHIIIYDGAEKVFDCIGDVRIRQHDDELTEIIVQIEGDAD